MLSVVIPFLSGKEALIECIKSIRREVIESEIIVVNDSGKSLSLNLNIKIINNETTLGAAYSRNKGLEFSSHDIVMFSDCDVIYQKNSIKYLLSNISNFDFVFPKIVYDNGVIMHPIDCEKESPQISTCFLIKKSSMNKLDYLFDESYKIYLEDSDFFLRTKLLGLKSKFVSNAIVKHKLKYSYNENRFFLENRNIFYGYFKFLFINKKDYHHPFHLRSIISNFVCAIFNFDKFDWSHYDRSLPLHKKIVLLFNPHKKFSSKNFFFRLFDFFKGFFSMVLLFNEIISKRKKLVFKLKNN